MFWNEKTAILRYYFLIYFQLVKVCMR